MDAPTTAGLETGAPLQSLLTLNQVMKQLPTHPSQKARRMGHTARSIEGRAAFKMGFNLFQGFAFGLREEECRDDEVNHREAGKEKEHG